MYVGAGAAPLLAAAAAWNGIAVELSAAASSFESVIMRLSTEQWMGPASQSMATAAQPLLVWLTYSAESSALAAAQAMASAAAFETAFAMTVPPAEVAANRAQLAALIATNILGQNVPAIAATEARYGEMWAQDASAMYGYAASSAAAGRLNPLTRPSHITNPAGIANQAAAVGHAAPAASAAHPADVGIIGQLAALDRAHIPLLDAAHHSRAGVADFASALITLNEGDADTEGTASGAAPGVAAAAALAHSVTPAGVGGTPLLAGLGMRPRSVACRCRQARLPQHQR
jgi:hypothetical protein